MPTPGAGQSSFDITNNSKHLIFEMNSDKEYAVFEDARSAVQTLPQSLFYENTTEQRGLTGLFNYYTLGDTKSVAALGGGKLSYIHSERRESNQAVTPDVSRNPTAHNIITETTKSGQYLDPFSPYIGQVYNVKDFIFCKHYGIIPNNRMLTLRRFPTPVMDNLKVPIAGKRPYLDQKSGKSVVVEKETRGITPDDMKTSGAHVPLAQAVGYFGDNTGNDLNSIIGFTTGLNWQPNTQDPKKNVQSNDPGLMQSALADFLTPLAGADAQKQLQGISNTLGTIGDPGNIETKIQRQLFDKLTQGDGPLSSRIFVDVNTVSKMYTRGLGLTGGESDFNLTFTYTLTSVGEMNSRMLFMDLIANLLSLGTDYGKFLLPQILFDPMKQGVGFPGGSEGHVKFILDPVSYLNDVLMGKLNDSVASKAKGLEDNANQLKEEFQKYKSGQPITKDSLIYKTLTSLLTTQSLNKLLFEPMMLTGYPTGNWHLVVGNPLNPIAMIGNLICKSVQLKFNSILGPDDFPTEVTAIYSMSSARQRHRGDFESMFNRGQGRFYLGKLPMADQSAGAVRGVQNGASPLDLKTNNLRDTTKDLTSN